MKPNFSKILKQLMRKKGVNQLALSELLGIRQSQISNWVNGKSLPGYYSLKVICEVFKISADELLEIKCDEVLKCKT